ncbi:MAG: UDP-N-acetylmuramoyl-L-alanine--D-glutamate ligase [Candidatus Gottesmanbacteria bacterium]|nr:UDP-N-acetylmuramoyl-L-alanine--D-glutamate ligase [Candidatus Gottesmanbacteria bacterium]
MRDFKGTHIAVLGISTEGCDTVKFLHARGAVITCCDRRGKDALGSVYPWASSLGVSFQLGETYLHNLNDFEIVVRTPGMSPRLPELIDFVRRGGETTSLTKLFFAECVAPIIGVTGTKGKGTTSTLIASMLEAAGLTVHLGGNVGIPLLSRVDSIKPNDWVVLELSSFQLEDLTQSPQIAVILKTTQEHLANFDSLATNFHETRQAYVQSKKSIVRYQTANDFVIVNKDDPTSSSFSEGTKAQRVCFSSLDPEADAYIAGHAVHLRNDGTMIKLVDRESVKLRGDHNLENIAAAALAAKAVGVSIESIRMGATTFSGLEHRLEFVRSGGGVSYFNDSFSTVPETAIAAVKSFDSPMVLIVGGSEKGSDFTEMGEVIAHSRVRSLIVIGDMTERIVKAIGDGGYKGPCITGLRTMKDIVQCASKEAQVGDTVLLSPACASFDMFPNYKERGRQFKKEVHESIF